MPGPRGKKDKEVKKPVQSKGVGRTPGRAPAAVGKTKNSNYTQPVKKKGWAGLDGL